MQNIDIPLQPKQRRLNELIEDAKGPVIIGAGGSKGSSKSHAIRSIMLLRRLRYPGTAGLIFRRKMKQHRENHLEGGYFKQWPWMRDWWKESTRTIALPNGSRIVFGVAEHPGDIDDFQGHEYMDVMADEATRLSQIELVKLNECRRWTGRYGGPSIPDRLCKTLYGMNPGGPGHNYIRRLMYKRKFQDKERPEDYVFLQMFAWDNVEWCRSQLEMRGLTDKDYYSWTDKERYNFFIEFTQRGHELDNLPARLRKGWLLGLWDEFGGQFYDIFSEDRHVKKCQPERDWHPRWLGIDWGYQHPLACYWMARVERTTKIYREYVENLRSARSQAMEIVDQTPKDERKLIDAIYLSPDAFQKKSEQDSFAELMGQIFQDNGMPYPTPADDDRIHGAQCMYDLMDDDELEIDPKCTNLIECIPMVCTAEDDPEEIEKFEGDDPWDAARYGLKSRQRPGEKPSSEVADEKVEKWAKEHNKDVEELDINVIAGLHRRAMAAEKKRRSRRRGGLGRIWRPPTVNA